MQHPALAQLDHRPWPLPARAWTWRQSWCDLLFAHWPVAPALLARDGPAGPVQPAVRGSLDHWLTERYCLYARKRSGALLRTEVHHAPWPLQPAQAEIARNTMTMPLGLALPDSAPVLHFARRMDVVVYPPERVA